MGRGGRIVGRAHEREWLQSALAASAGTGAVVVGEPGLGKTRLLAEAARLAPRGSWLVVSGRADDADLTPMRPLVEVAAQATRDGVPADPALDPYRAALSVVVPALRAAAPPTSHVEPLMTAEAVLRLLRIAAAGRRVLILLDDLQWADDGALLAVEYLLERAPATGAVVIAAVRDEPAAAAGVARLRRLVARAGIAWLRLSPLADDEVRELVRCTSADADVSLVEFVVEHADGVPFFAEELVVSLDRRQPALERGVVDDVVVPEAVAASFDERLAALPPTAATIVAAAAVAGMRFDLRLVAAATGVPLDAAEELAAALVRARLVESDTGWDYRFRHSLTRQTLLARQPGHVRSRTAAELLDALDDAADARGVHAGADTRQLVARLAVTAQLPARAVATYTQLAEDAARVGALAEATSAYRQAIDATDDPSTARELSVRLLETLVAAGDLGAAELLGRSLAGDDDGAVAARARLALAELAVVRHDWDAASAVRGIDQTALPATGRVRVHLVEAEELAGRFRHGAAATAAATAVELAAGLGDGRLEISARLTWGRVLSSWDQPAARARLAEAAAEAGERGLGYDHAVALSTLADLEVLGVGDPEVCERALAAAYDASALGLVAAATHDLAMLHLLRYELAAGERWAAECVDVARRYQLGWLEAAGLTKQGFGAALRGRRVEATALFDEAERLAHGDARGVSLIHGNGVAAACLNDEELPEALAATRRAVRLAEQHRLEPRPYVGLWLLLEASAGGDVTELRAAVAKRHADWPGVIAGLGAAAAAVTAGRRGDADTALAHADDAWPLLAATPWHLAIARRYVAEAQLADGWGDAAAVAEPALAFFTDADLAPPRDACAALLRRTGRARRRRRPSESTPHELAARGVTAREAEVLLLVAEGLTNRQIAQRLFLSPRTVDKHVQRLLDKLAAPNRAALAVMTAREPALTRPGKST